MSLETPRDLFLHELSDLMSAEHIFHKILGEMADLSDHADAKKAYSSHQKETEGHIDRLNKMFEIMGEKPEQVTCMGADGLRQEHDSLKEEKPEGVVKEMGMLMGADKSEHYEISAYRNLNNFARRARHWRHLLLRRGRGGSPANTRRQCRALGPIHHPGGIYGEADD